MESPIPANHDQAVDNRAALTTLGRQFAWMSRVLAENVLVVNLLACQVVMDFLPDCHPLTTARMRVNQK